MSETIIRVGNPNPNWRDDYIPDGDAEPCICNRWGPCRFHEKLQDRLEKFANTPNERGNYPSDADCDGFEREGSRGTND